MPAYGHRLFYVLNHHIPRRLRALSTAVTLLGNPAVMIGGAALIALAIGKRDGLRVFGAALVARTAAKLVGGLSPRERPWQELPGVRVAGRLDWKPSFPSRHAATSVAFATALAAVRPKWRKPALAFAALVSLARIAQGQHYPTDVLAGAALGATSAAAVGALG